MHVGESLEEERKIEKEREIERNNAKAKKSKEDLGVDWEKRWTWLILLHILTFANICFTSVQIRDAIPK